MNARLRYAIVTPAHNEERYIEKTLRSMAAQTVVPERWVIVNDGSTDATSGIVRQYVSRFPWIKLIELPVHRDRQFAAKVSAFNAGYASVKDSGFDVIGNLDADLSFDPDYMEYLLTKMEADPKLGVTGTPFVEDKTEGGYDFRFANIEHVSGACQLFRRDCYEEIGGYTPIRGGGIDWVAVTSARMKGWKTRTFTDRTLFHHRKMGTAKGHILRARFRLGREDYYLGSHPLWEMFRSFFQIRYKPYVFGGMAILAGYCWAALKRVKRPIPRDLLRFHRKEQMARLRSKLSIGKGTISPFS